MTTKKDVFYSTDNFNMLYDILIRDLNTKFNFNLKNKNSSEENDLKQILFSNMNKAFFENESEKLKEINIETIKIVAPLFLENITIKNNNNNNNEDFNDVLNKSSSNLFSKKLPIRDISLGKETPIYTNIRPEFNQKDDSINDIFEKINLERNQNVTINQKPIDFKIVSNDNFQSPNDLFSKENNNREKEFLKFQKLQEDQNNYEEVNNVINENNNNILLNKTINEKENFNQEIFYDKNENMNETNISELENRLELLANIRTNNNNNTNYNNLDLYKMEEVIKEENKKIINNNYHSQESIIHNTNLEILEKINYVIIESIDRFVEKTNIKNNNRYNFRVLFSPAIKEEQQYPMFKNNPTILATKEESNEGKRGKQNINGWFDNNGIEYPPYDSNKNYGEIVCYENITFSGTNNLYIENRLKNISEIKLINMIIPYENLHHYANIDKSNARDIIALKEPYLLLHIEEINGIYNSTSNLINSCFCKLIIDEIHNIKINNNDELCDEFGGNIVFIPSINNISKKYYPAPLASLNSLTIKILRPNGELVSSNKDFNNIKSIKYESPSTYNGLSNIHLKIKLNNYVKSSIFKKYTNIIFKNYKIPVDVSVCYKKNEFELFINRKEGHEILFTENENNDLDTENINIIYIASQGEFDNYKGIYEIYNYDNELENLIDNLEELSDLFNDENFKDLAPFGIVINSSMQCHLSFEITTLENKVDNKNITLI